MQPAILILICLFLFFNILLTAFVYIYIRKHSTRMKSLESLLVQDKKTSPDTTTVNDLVQTSVLHSLQTKLDAITSQIARQYGLTKQEERIMYLSLEGFTAKEIAVKCSVTVSTTNTHIRNIYSKLNVTCKRELKEKVLEAA